MVDRGFSGYLVCEIRELCCVVVNYDWYWFVVGIFIVYIDVICYLGRIFYVCMIVIDLYCFGCCYFVCIFVGGYGLGCCFLVGWEEDY